MLWGSFGEVVGMLWGGFGGVVGVVRRLSGGLGVPSWRLGPLRPSPVVLEIRHIGPSGTLQKERLRISSVALDSIGLFQSHGIFVHNR